MKHRVMIGLMAMLAVSSWASPVVLSKSMDSAEIQVGRIPFQVTLTKSGSWRLLQIVDGKVDDMGAG